MYSDQGYSSVFVNWTKQVCLQTRLEWWKWWGTPDIIWNRVPDRRSKRKWTITKCCLTVCRSIEKRHGVWAGASVQWLSMQHVSDIWWCSTAVAVVAQTSYFVSLSYFSSNQESVPYAPCTGYWLISRADRQIIELKNVFLYELTFIFKQLLMKKRNHFIDLLGVMQFQWLLLQLSSQFTIWIHFFEFFTCACKCEWARYF